MDPLQQREENSAIKAGSLKRNLIDKLFLIVLKFICHVEGMIYVLYTILSLWGIDAVNIGYIADMSLLTWTFIIFSSFRFRFCYVHRLPLYYIFVNELITTIDYLFGIPLSDRTLLVIHILLIGILIESYSIYYLKKRR